MSETEYIYTDESGNPLHKTIRYGKQHKPPFTQQHYSGGKWVSGLDGVETTLYRLTEVIQAVHNSKPVIIVEGEKDADNLAALGFTATTNPMGAGKWKEQYSKYFKDAVVFLIPDNDKTGKNHMKKVGDSLEGSATDVNIIWLDRAMQDFPTKGDISDYLTINNLENKAAIDEVNRLMATAEPFKVIPDGERNIVLFTEACRLRGQGKNEAEIIEAVTALNQTRCNPPEDDEVIIELCKRVVKTYAAGINGKIPPLSSHSMLDLQSKELEPIRWVVAEMLPQGLALLASPPKYGKSWFVLDLCLSVASGDSFLKHKTEKSGCLYLALEDSEHRLKDRVNKLTLGSPAPCNFDYAITAQSIDNGLIEQLEQYISQKPQTALIVIDTLQKVRGAVGSRESAYAADYKEISTLKSFADKHSICLLLVHHLRKGADDDVFNRISGTNGIFGSADTAMVMERDKRQAEDTKLHITGRDVEQNEYLISFDKAIFKWKLKGIADEIEAIQAAEEYEQNPLVQTIQHLVKESSTGWCGTMNDLLEQCIEIVGECPVVTAIALSNALKPLYPLLLLRDNIKHTAPGKNGGAGGRKHRFYKAVTDAK